jgi:hypothetical protein
VEIDLFIEKTSSGILTTVITTNPNPIINRTENEIRCAIDVEEQGLFRGVYPKEEGSVNNIFELDRLDYLFLEQGTRPKLLISYQVASIKHIIDKIISLKNRWNAEVGEHLHHWNTPPTVIDSIRPPTLAELLSADILEAKMRSLIDILSINDLEATSFHGRFQQLKGRELYARLKST